jgi:hypothetical protein
MGPRAVLDAVVKRKIPSYGRESNPRTPIVQPTAQRYSKCIYNFEGGETTSRKIEKEGG